MYNTRKAQYPGSAVLSAEFAAVATPEQLALAEAVLAADGTWTVYDARWGVCTVFNRTTRRDVLFFNRITGTVEVAA